MNEKARAHETLAMLIGAMGAEHDSAARKRVEDLREYVTSLESDWQPIDTAPKDGTRVLLAQRDPDFPLQSDEGAWYQFTGSFKHGEWYCDEYDAFEKWPTHWKPLGPNPDRTRDVSR